MATAVLLLSCPDQKGLVAGVSDFIYRHDGNILHADQHIDSQQSIFFQRVEWELEGFAIPRERIGEAFRPLAERFGMTWDLRFSDTVPRMAILVSTHEHCMYDLLSRQRMQEFTVAIPLVISNHPDLRSIAESFSAAFHCVPVTPDTRAPGERRMLDVLREHRIDVIVLARYMRILSGEFVSHYPNRIINIHHSFLPAFAGSRPYHRAFERGVKIIGATAHYVTAQLDEGPIIEQDVVRASHRDSVQDLMRKGKDLEKLVLARAVSLHLANRILAYGSKTVVFD
jgi:formyltetrahydrofolate deformylase